MSDPTRAGERARSGPVLTGIVVGDPPAAWRHAGFDVAPDGTFVVGSVRIALTGVADAPGRGIESWAFDPLAADPHGDIDGLPTRPAPRDVPAGADRRSHPNGVTALDHVVVLSPDLPRTVASFERHGFEVRRVRDAEVGDQPVRQVFFRAGEAILEVVGRAGSGAGGPARFWGLAFATADLDATKARLGDALDDPHHAVQPGRRIATLRRSDRGPSVAVAFMGPA